jgi:sugar/nucleoside kinase (ribokinase family)
VCACSSYDTVGSTGAGKALNLARLGHQVHLHTLIGADYAGQRVVNELTRSGVIVHKAIIAGPTERQVNLMAADGSRLSIHLSVASAPVDLDLRPIVAVAAECDAVVLNIIEYVRPLYKALNTGGRLVVCTRGAKGAVASDTDGQEHHVAAVPFGPAID